MFVAAIALFFIIFSASNHQAAAISLFPLPYAVDIPVFLLVMLSILLGVIISMLAMVGKLSKLRHLYVSEKKRAVTFETELKSIRAKNTSISNLPDLRG